MENFDLNFLSKRVKNNKRKIYENINENINENLNGTVVTDLSPDKIKKMQKTQDEKFIQLFDDSDSLEEISPELSIKLEEEEEKKIRFANNIKIIDEKGYIKKNRSFKMRNSSLNLGFVNYKKTFFSEKDNKVQDDLNDKKTYSNKKNILLYDSKIIEEDEEKEVEEKNSILEEKSISKIGTENKLNKIITEESPDNSNNSNLKFKISKNKDFTSTSSGKKSRLLDEIKNLSQTINVYYLNQMNQ